MQAAAPSFECHVSGLGMKILYQRDLLQALIESTSAAYLKPLAILVFEPG